MGLPTKVLDDKNFSEISIRNALVNTDETKPVGSVQADKLATYQENFITTRRHNNIFQQYFPINNISIIYYIFLFHIPNCTLEVRDFGLLGFVMTFTVFLDPKRYTSQDSHTALVGKQSYMRNRK